MLSAFDEIMPDPGEFYTTEIASVSYPNDDAKIFVLEFELWPSEFEYKGPKRRWRLVANGVEFIDENLRVDLAGYGLSDIKVDKDSHKLGIYTTIWGFDMYFEDFRLQELR